MSWTNLEKLKKKTTVGTLLSKEELAIDVKKVNLLYFLFFS